MVRSGWRQSGSSRPQDALQVVVGEGGVARDLDAGETMFRESEVQFVHRPGRAAAEQHDDDRHPPEAVEPVPRPGRGRPDRSLSESGLQEFSLPVHPATC